MISLCVMLSAPEVQGKSVLVVYVKLMLLYLWEALSSLICKGKNWAVLLNPCWHRKCLWSFSTAKMEKTLTDVHHSLLPLHTVLQGLPVWWFVSHFLWKNQEIREILKHTELSWFQVEVHMWKFLSKRTRKVQLWRKYNLFSDFTREKKMFPLNLHIDLHLLFYWLLLMLIWVSAY